jgi:sigma-B regulation protein RsbU (phosphoserine phosphatase)
MLVLSSDAASEAENDQKQLFGLDRLSDLLEQFHDAGAKNMPDLIVHALTDWRLGSTLEDDLTIVTLERAFPNDTHNIA